MPTYTHLKWPTTPYTYTSMTKEYIKNQDEK